MAKRDYKFTADDWTDEEYEFLMEAYGDDKSKQKSKNDVESKEKDSDNEEKKDGE